MPGVGDQRHGIGEHAVGELHRDESQIEADTDGEGHAEACGSVDMGVPMMVMIGVVMHVIAIKKLMWAHGEHETSMRRVMIYASAPYMHPPRGHTAVPPRRTRLWLGREAARRNELLSKVFVPSMRLFV